MIIYRDPDVSSATLLRAFSVAFWSSLIGTVAETATILGLYGALWNKWTLTMKIMIPILHCIFTAAQLWGEKCTWDLWQQEKRRAKGVKAGADQISSSERRKTTDETETKGKHAKAVNEVEMTNAA